MTNGTASIRGAEIAYEIAEHPSADSTAPTFIWGHGLTQNRVLEDETAIFDWSTTPARTVRYDARGHGETTTTPVLDDYSWRSLALDQLALADELGIDRYVAGGASMGCATAMHAAVLAPERIEALVLVIPPTGWETRAAQIDTYAAGAHVIETKGVEPVIAAQDALAPPDPFVGDSSYRERRAAGLRSWDPRRLAQAFRGAGRADLPDRTDLAAITCPTLVLAWTGDPGHPVSSAEEIDRLIASSTLHLASTADHLATWPQLVAAFVASL